MTTSKWIAVAMAAALGAGGLTVLNARAAKGPVEQRPGRGQFLERAKEKLDLTDDQIDQIRAELGGEREALKDLVSRLHQTKVGLREAIHAADGTEASVRAASAKVAKVQAELAVERWKLFTRINPILTEEQRAKVKQFEEQLDEFLDGAIKRLGERLSPGK